MACDYKIVTPNSHIDSTKRINIEFVECREVSAMHIHIHTLLCALCMLNHSTYHIYSRMTEITFVGEPRAARCPALASSVSKLVSSTETSLRARIREATWQQPYQKGWPYTLPKMFHAMNLFSTNCLQWLLRLLDLIAQKLQSLPAFCAWWLRSLAHVKRQHESSIMLWLRNSNGCLSLSLSSSGQQWFERLPVMTLPTKWRALNNYIGGASQYQ